MKQYQEGYFPVWSFNICKKKSVSGSKVLA